MNVEIFVGLPYNKWMSVDEAFKKVTKPEWLFKNFRLSKGDFFFQLTTNLHGAVEIQVKLPYLISISL